ncbi:PLP-dependent aminotransferase family protein [Brevibacillus parabrevis]|uniref:aminotransferase-like domain-containing protein n=1 Tax=Brevibacillus parabrevis TaxID=54914 RepID=UPI0036F3719F
MLLLTLKWNEATNEPQYVQLYTYIKNEIIAGRLAEKVRLPSVRKLADLLGLSTTPVEMAYQQLLAEGFIQSRPRSGYFVEKLPDPEFSPKEKSQHEQPGWNRPTVRDARNYQYDFHMSQNDFALFPYTLWRRLYNQLLCQAREEDLFYGDPQGEPGLRRQIADYLHRYRGVTCSPDQIVVGADQFGLLSLICLMLKPQLERIGAENPGYLLYANTFRQHGYETVPLSLLEDGSRCFRAVRVAGAARRRFYTLLRDTLLEQSASRLHQRAMGAFMQNGHLEKHVRKMRSLYRKKHDALLAAVQKHFGARAAVIGADAGFHVLLRIYSERSEEELKRLAIQAGVRVSSTAFTWLKPPVDMPKEFFLGFSGIALDQIEPGIAALCQAWFGDS